MENFVQKIYENHHLKNRPENFSVLEKERGLFLKKHVGIGKKILDLGSRDGNLTRYFVRDNDVTAVDIDRNALLRVSKNLGIKTICADLNGEWDELNGEKFDVIFTGEILEHLYYSDQVIEKVLLHLNRGGLFIGSVPNAFSLKNRLRFLKGSKKFTSLSDPTHINHFSYKELKELLQKYFQDVKIIGLGRYIWLSRIFPSFFAFDLFFVVSNL